MQTLHHLCPEKSADLENQVRSLTAAIFNDIAPVDEDLAELLPVLKSSYKVAILTAGDPAVQHRRLEVFPYTDQFDAVEIVKRKTPQVFTSFCQQHAVDRPRSYVIGDSLRSDIIPAREAGLNAIWVKKPNWHEVEIEGHMVPDGVKCISRLSELTRLIWLN